MKRVITASALVSGFVIAASIIFGFLSTSQGKQAALEFYENIPSPVREWWTRILHNVPGRKYEPNKKIFIYMNGDHDNGREVSVTQDHEKTKNLGSLLSPLFNCKRVIDVPDVDPNTPCRVFNSVGREVQNTANVSNGDMLFLVPPDRHFIWPTIEVGRKVTVPHVRNKKGVQVEVETISIAPRVFMLYNFFDFDEADQAIHDALSMQEEDFKLKRSSTGTKGKAIASTRTSDNAFVTATPNSMTLKRRIFSLLGMEFRDTWADGLQVLRYNESQAYNDHLDYLEEMPGSDHSFDSGHLGTNRFATVVLYLNDVEAGGETVFSYADGSPKGRRLNPKESVQSLRENATHSALVDSSGIKPGTWEERLAAECIARLAVKPIKGTAVLFYNQLPDGKKDELSRHGACPILVGQKWAANLWVWNGPRYGYTELDQYGRTVAREGLEDGPFKVKLLARNEDVPNAKLYYGDNFFEDWPLGKTIGINSFTGHTWNAVVGGKVVKTWSIKQRLSEQTILLWRENLDSPLPTDEALPINT